jgi:hypothetical protein
MQKATFLLMVAIAAAAPVAFADDAPSDNPVKSPKQKMHECVHKQQSDNPGMDLKSARKACAAILQHNENHPSKPVTPDSPPQN